MSVPDAQSPPGGRTCQELDRAAADYAAGFGPAGATERAELRDRFVARCLPLAGRAEIAAELGISQMHVSRMLSRALSWLREAMFSDTLPRWAGAGELSDRHTIAIRTVRDGARLTLLVRGEVDRDTAGRLRADLRRAVTLDATDRLVVDLAAVPLVDAAGVAALVDAASAAAAADVELSLTGAQPLVARILGVGGLRSLLAARS